MFSRASQVVRDTLYALRFYYQARPWLFVALAMILLVRAAVPVLTLGFEKVAVDRFLTGSLKAAAWAIAAYLVCRLIGSLADEYEKLVQTVLTDLTGKRISLMVSGLLESIPTLEIYHDASYHDSLETLNSLGSKLAGAVLGLSFGGVAAARFVSLAVILASVSPWIPVLLALSLIPHAILEQRLREAQFKGNVGLAPERRKIDYVGSLLFEPRLAKEIKLFGLADHILKLYTALFNSVLKKQSALHRKQTVMSVAGSLISLAGIGFAVVTTVSSYRRGTLSAGGLVLALGSLESMSAYAGSMVGHLGRALQNSMYMGRLRELVSAAGKASRGQGQLTIDSAIEVIEVRDLWFAYPGSSRRALDGVNFTLRRGETVALVGLNGAGKTTLAKILLGLYRPGGGSLTVNGLSYGDYDLYSLRSRMSCLFQDFVRYKLTVRDAISFGALSTEEVGVSEARDDRLAGAISEAGADQLVAAAGGLDAQLGKEFGGTDLSGGEWQKLALARTLLRDADFLVLDEPSSALDAEAEFGLYNRFKSMSRDRICLLISHRFTTVSIADRIIVLSNGRVIEEGSHGELVDRNGEYARMYRLQAEQYTGSGGVVPSSSSAGERRP